MQRLEESESATREELHERLDKMVEDVEIIVNSRELAYPPRTEIDVDKMQVCCSLFLLQQN